MRRRFYRFDMSQSKLLRAAMRGTIVHGMARKPLFRAQNKPVMAVTWPFADLAALEKVRALMDEQGYATYIHQRRDLEDLWELIIGQPIERPEEDN